MAVGNTAAAGWAAARYGGGGRYNLDGFGGGRCGGGRLGDGWYGYGDGKLGGGSVRRRQVGRRLGGGRLAVGAQRRRHRGWAAAGTATNDDGKLGGGRYDDGGLDSIR